MSDFQQEYDRLIRAGRDEEAVRLLSEYIHSQTGIRMGNIHAGGRITVNGDVVRGDVVQGDKIVHQTNTGTDVFIATHQRRNR